MDPHLRIEMWGILPRPDNSPKECAVTDEASGLVLIYAKPDPETLESFPFSAEHMIAMMRQQGSLQ
jgi:hypothetical protein